MKLNILKLITLLWHDISYNYKRRVLIRTIMFALTGSLVYTSMLLFGLVDHYAYFRSYIGIITLAIALSLLLSVDDEKKISKTAYQKGIFYFVFYFVLSRGASTIAVVLFISSLIIIMTNILSSSLQIELSNERGLVIGTRSQPIHFFAVNPFESWQKTGIKVHKGDTLEVSLSGAVSPGYAQNIKEINRWVTDAVLCDKNFDKEMMKCKKEPYCKQNNLNTLSSCRQRNGPGPSIPWPHTRPGGYNDSFYNEYSNKPEMQKYLKGLMHYNLDSGLTVKGRPHNAVIGVVSNDDSMDGVKFDWKKDSPLLYEFSDPLKSSFEVKSDGVLWVVINDANGFRLDNGGLYFLRLKINRF